jgi:DnaJ-class molecular chaperone
MAKDYYQILGVSKTANQDEIKKAYRKLAHEYHPDKAGGGTDQKFKEINEAYQVLSNPEKRQRYDQFGSAEPAGGFGWQDSSGFNANGFGFDFQGNGGGFGGFGDIFETIFSQAFADVQTEIPISFTQAALGEKIELRTTSNDRIVLNIPAGTQDGQTFRFPSKGNQTKRGRGDLIIVTRIQMPRHLTREQKELLEKLRQTGI